jgi:hypothetical protein
MNMITTHNTQHTTHNTQHTHNTLPLVSIFGDQALCFKVTKTLGAKTKASKLGAFKKLLKGGWKGALSDLKKLLKLRGENEKMRASLASQDYFLEAFVLPSEWIIEARSSLKDQVKQGELIACERDCVHRHDHPKNKEHGRCYVNPRFVIASALERAIKDHESGASFDLNSSYQVRFTAWGDVSTLNAGGRALVSRVIDASEAHLAYTAGWRHDHMSVFKGLFMASCSTVTEALLARASGFEPFMSSKEDKPRGFVQCPTDTTLERPKTLGCSVCPVPCDGGSPAVGRFIKVH